MRYSNANLIPDILSFLVNVFLSFPRPVNFFFHCLLHSKQGHRLTLVYISLRTENISSSCTYDFGQDLSFEPHKSDDYPCKTHGTIVDNTSFSHSPVSSKISNWYRPLHLPPIIHDFATKNYKYLPRFDG